jgi:hypothetical protein
MTFPISPLIRFSVQALYWALVLPLPLLLARQGTPLAQGALLAALLLGWGLLLGSLSQQIQVDAVGMRATYPAWVPPVVRQEWQIRWAEVEHLEPRSTSQGGLVYYLVSRSGDRVLLPMRVSRFRELVALVQRHTGLEIDGLRPYVQPWMYALLGGFALLLLLWDGIIAFWIWTAPS